MVTVDDVLDEHKKEIDKLKSNVKYIYSYGGVGGNGHGGSGGGGTGNPMLFVSLGGHQIQSGKDNIIVFGKPGQYVFEGSLSNAGGEIFYVYVGYGKNIKNPKQITLDKDNRWIIKPETYNLKENGEISVTLKDVEGKTRFSVTQTYVVNAHTFDAKFKYEFEDMEIEFSPYEYFMGNPNQRNPFIDISYSINIPNVQNVILSYNIKGVDGNADNTPYSDTMGDITTGSGSVLYGQLVNNNLRIYLNNLTRKGYPFIHEINTGTYDVTITLNYSVSGSPADPTVISFQITLIPNYLYINIRNNHNILYDTLEELKEDLNQVVEGQDLSKSIPVGTNTSFYCKDDAENGAVIKGKTYGYSKYPNIILNPRFIDGCAFSTASKACKETNPWYVNGDGGVGIQIKPNTMFRLMFALDPAKQAFNGFNGSDSSRIRYNKATDLQVLDLSKEFIGYPHSNEIIKIDRYTPRASFENRNVMTDKSQLNKEKPNMVTCSFGLDVYNTRCFNWISCGTFNEYVWVRPQGSTTWNRFQSYTKVSSNTAEDISKPIHRKEYLMDVNNAGYARMINRFPGNDVLFTSHKCVLVFPDASEPTVYEYVVGRPDKDNNPDFEHTNNIYTFTLYPRSYEGRVYQITDQQGFHWIEYQVWAAAAEFLNTKINSEISTINATATKKVFPILINTGDMTQSGARINEWLDYYNGGNHKTFGCEVGC